MPRILQPGEFEQSLDESDGFRTDSSLDGLDDEKREKASAELSDFHIFQNNTLVDHWAGVYDKSEYEGRHRFDPSFTWTKQEERELVWKLDTRLMLLVWVMFFSLDLVRHNLNRSLASRSEKHGGNILEEVGLSQNDINHGMLAFYLSFLCMELPSGLISKRLGPEVWVPTQIIAWSIVCACQSAITNKAGFYITRVFLGITQGGFIPDMCLYLTYFYTSKEMNVRMSFFYTVLGASQIIGSFLSVGFMQLNGLNGWAGWRYLFALDSVISGVIGLLAIFLMPATITKTTTFAIRKPWFTDREEKILVNRLLRDDPTKGDMNNHQSVTWRGLWNCLKDYDGWVIYALAFLVLIPYQPPQTYLSYILSDLGFNTLMSNLLAIPGMVLFMANALWMAQLATRFRARAWTSALTNAWVFPCLVALLCIPQKQDYYWNWVRYGLYSLVTAVPYPLPSIVGWVSENAYSVQTRTISLCFLNITAQIGSIAATFVYTDGDQPFYLRGNTAMAVLAGVSVVQCVLTPLYFTARNRYKAKKWAQLSPDEQQAYAVHSRDFGPRRLDTRLAT
ncbi:uncharacterized protein MJAP1_004085 [Malassezia japonica]|uniref:Uncharacterized protein n=1 Tax=Malassezia japonica TaxID=223818 RepID=A0AAF0FA32_9BASI|nr:uncharacterized protein MJAP1_004085 [Malassezia japonica]WFD41092.1 hypothetical protein MJAP1_004085 [Malassezia japonica]